MVIYGKTSQDYKEENIKMSVQVEKLEMMKWRDEDCRVWIWKKRGVVRLTGDPL